MTSAPPILKVGLIQHACPMDASVAQNLATAERLIREAAAKGAELIVTQELFTSHYFPQEEHERFFDLAEPIPGPTTRHLGNLAAELEVTISASLFEKRTEGVYHNTTVMLGPEGKLFGRYRKMHIPDDPRFFEKYYFTPGDLGFQNHTIPHPHHRRTQVGTLVCWDQWFPEAARLTALLGSQVLLYPTAIGYYNHPEKGELESVREQQLAAWRTIQTSHAIANGVFVVAVNRIGVESDLTFWGTSFVSDPTGKIIAETSRDQEEALVVDLDLSLIEPQRRGWPFLRDRRIDAYQGLNQRLLLP